MLNQDCLPQAGWLSALATAFTAQPQFGIAGCTIYFADGRLDHAGAYMTRPSALGEHLTEVGREPRVVDFVTGAAMAIQHAVFDQIGLFDEGFYPAYYEECDFCYRAREHDFETAYVPAARITHLRSSREAQTDPIKLFGNHQRARYRFIIKQFNPKEIGEFIAFEIAAIESEVEFTHAVARIFGARDTLRALPDIVERRRRDRNDELSPAVRRQLEVGFTTILRRAFARAESLGAPSSDQAREKLSSRLITQLSNWTRRSTLTNPDREIDQLKQQLLDMREGFERRLRLLEILTDYDYR